VLVGMQIDACNTSHLDSPYKVLKRASPKWALANANQLLYQLSHRFCQYQRCWQLRRLIPDAACASDPNK
jgi:hypothetical protein